MIRFTAIFITLFTWISGTNGQSNKYVDKEAKQIIKSLDHKYNKWKGIKVDLQCNVKSSEGEKDNFTGTLYLRPGNNKYKIIFPVMEIFSDGINVYTYLKEAKEMQINSLKNNEGGNNFNPLRLLAMNEKEWKYIVKSRLKQKDGSLLTIIESVPTGTMNFSKIEFSINEKGKELKKLKIFYKNGDSYLYTIKNIQPANIEESFFTYDKVQYHGTEIIDLR